jgi:hypothetical protein
MHPPPAPPHPFIVYHASPSTLSRCPRCSAAAFEFGSDHADSSPDGVEFAGQESQEDPEEGSAGDATPIVNAPGTPPALVSDALPVDALCAQGREKGRDQEEAPCPSTLEASEAVLAAEPATSPAPAPGPTPAPTPALEIPAPEPAPAPAPAPVSAPALAPEIAEPTPAPAPAPSSGPTSTTAATASAPVAPTTIIASSTQEPPVAATSTPSTAAAPTSTSAVAAPVVPSSTAPTSTLAPANSPRRWWDVGDDLPEVAPGTKPRDTGITPPPTARPGSVAEQAAAAAAASSASAPVPPEGWLSAVDPTTQRTYFYHPVTQQTMWAEVAVTPVPDW